MNTNKKTNANMQSMNMFRARPSAARPSSVCSGPRWAPPATRYRYPGRASAMESGIPGETSQDLMRLSPEELVYRVIKAKKERKEAERKRQAAESLSAKVALGVVFLFFLMMWILKPLLRAS